MNNGNGFNHHGVPTPGLVHPQMQNLVQGFNGNGFNHHLPVYNPSSDDSEDEGRNNIVIEELPSDYPSDDDQEEGNFIVNESSDDSEDSHSSDDPQDGVVDVHQPAAHDDQVEAIVIKKTDYDPQGEAIDVHRTDDIQGGSDFDHHAAHDLQEEAIDVPQTANDPENNHYFRVVPGRNISGIVLFAVMIFFLLKRTETKSLDERNGEASIHVGDIYHRDAPFLRNYAAMERDFKVFGGNATTCYHSTDRKSKSKYATEHYFFMNLRDSRFLTNDPHKAHFFFIPISCQKWGAGEKVIQTYVKSLVSSYPYWNRTLGADHFFVSCHDFGSRATEEVPFLLKNAIQLVCSPSYDSNYIPQKDVALPQILELSLPPHHGYGMRNRSTVKSRPLMIHPEMMLPRRTKLGFWACSLNSDVRKNLLIFYKGAPEFNFHFIDKMKRAAILDAYENELYGSKFCICPRWNNHLGGVCLTESMTFGCVPVILSDYYDLPFNDVLDWNNFSVNVPNLEKILKEIPEENYKKMHQNLLQVDMNFVPFLSNKCLFPKISIQYLEGDRGTRSKRPDHGETTKYSILVRRLGSTSNGILFLSSMICFAWLCMSYGCAATSLSIELRQWKKFQLHPEQQTLEGLLVSEAKSAVRVITPSIFCSSIS
ncbi:hypothetical protein OIU77_002889 [Salix suchowensis]|uniref:Exostosin GT47 domain-containing protein n=1 Tax=Salix suchowensis TaxID=1278906 RepID=A0ABQ9AZE1_9ROSI|nr:hypothetical protein OIU77_002889 [Salix suchowensis]